MPMAGYFTEEEERSNPTIPPSGLSIGLVPPHLTLPYLTLPFGTGVLPLSAEASSGPSAHPRINPKVIETYRFLQT